MFHLPPLLLLLLLWLLLLSLLHQLLLLLHHKTTRVRIPRRVQSLTVVLIAITVSCPMTAEVGTVFPWLLFVMQPILCQQFLPKFQQSHLSLMLQLLEKRRVTTMRRMICIPSNNLIKQWPLFVISPALW
jgi:hypothetical protein